MDREKENNEIDNCYKALLIYGTIGVVCIVNIFNVMENKRFGDQLTKQINLCKKMSNKRKTDVEL